MSHLRDIAPAGRVEDAADPPSNTVAQAHQSPPGRMDGKLVQWVSAQAGNMAEDLQHNARALMVGEQALPCLCLLDMIINDKLALCEAKPMLKNQALAIETFQSKWQMAGQEAHTSIRKQRTSSVRR